MADTRYFLGWDRPILPAAAEWLWERYAGSSRPCLVVVPTARAGRRLLEILAERAEASSAGPWLPPTIETVGRVPETLCALEEDAAGDWDAMLARVASLRQAGPATLEPLVPRPPAASDTLGWWRLAERLAQLSDDLAASQLTPAEVLQRASELEIDLGLSEPRWRALAELEQRYRAMLGRADRQQARAAAISGESCKSELPVVLIGVVDLSKQLHAILSQVENVTALVPAPAEHAAGFDAIGGLVAGYWLSQPLSTPGPTFVPQPADQAVAVVEALAGWSASPDEISIAVGDEPSAPAMQRTLELAGAPSRVAAGTPLRRSGPALALELLSRFAATSSFDDLAAIARHPDLEPLLGEEDWPSRLDDFASTFLQADLESDQAGPAEGRESLAPLRQSLAALLPDGCDRELTLPEWAPPIAELLEAIYGRSELLLPRDHDRIEAITALGKALRDLAGLDASSPQMIRLPFDQAVGLLLDQASQINLPPASIGPAVELLGFLELPWDDAPHAAITDLNEGQLPATRQGDAFLPDTLRQSLGMPDAATRFARDRLLLQITLRSRPETRLFACRSSPAGDPRVPSRLLLAGDRDQRADRLRDYYPKESQLPAAPRVRLLEPGGQSRFLIPPPLMSQRVIDSLPVTAFRDYLACPYRFYLKHVERLGELDDRAVELDALAYGSLAHDVLEAFGRSDTAHAADPGKIETFLRDTLDTLAAHRFGARARPAVRVQIEQIRERLNVFAKQQARLTQAGWQIRRDLLETSLEAKLTIDGRPFTLRGKIDRVDEHPQLGFRLLDYKTSDAGHKPEKTHVRRGEWIDLQLPLYRQLIEPLGVTDAALGYINLPKDPADAGLKLAQWSADELGLAMRVRDLVVMQVRQQKFWPPREDPPAYADAFRRIAADQAMDRPGLIQRSGEVGDV